MTSDFAASWELVFRGICPLCDRALEGLWDLGNLPTAEVHGDCDHCDVGWKLTVLNKERQYLWPDRQLFAEEIRTLYSRKVGEAERIAAELRGQADKAN